jgi:GNAT superfamily N-acetyltransferase
MGPVASAAGTIRHVDNDQDVLACFPLMRQLRPNLDTAEAFLERWRHQTIVGYRLAALWQGDQPVALAGFRLQENLIHGVHFYVDDLVTDESLRSTGQGHAIMDWLKAEASRLGCHRMILDTPLTNALGHRFYFRHGLLARALRFSIDLTAEGG